MGLIPGGNPLEEEIATHLPGESHGQNLHVLQVDALLLNHWGRSHLMLNLTIKCRVFLKSYFIPQQRTSCTTPVYEML